MTDEEILVALGNKPEVVKLLPVIKPYLPALTRENDQKLVEEFAELVGKKSWGTLDALMWGKMTDDERDQLSDQILEEAKKAVNNLKLGGDLLRSLVIKILFTLLTV
jgi:hypothetical protein